MTEADTDRSRQPTIDPVIVTTIVEAPLERCFALFTTGMASWWPPTHHIGSQDSFTAVLEPHAGGRWYERGADGSVCDWGRVLTWEPPHRLMLDWQIGTDWTFDPTLHTEVDVRFVVINDARTRVDLEHRHLEAFGDGAPAMREAFDSPGGWAGIAGAFAAGATP